MPDICNKGEYVSLPADVLEEYGECPYILEDGMSLLVNNPPDSADG
jgi:hypothetical protein